eukprot:CAMPEP_0119314484 /NCGR_PEP_ID=MMETSP1333-20130426/32898_1 /TAXON_ID=418940 /ORGANISM="Scyphosphaera apsteinii, Strain RCC1455" /LENGTH=476 /DNA_ID=CAMNT_0007319599 /DNA_START=226 /DNA_END=1656 /DNA_ORIENTATION=+
MRMCSAQQKWMCARKTGAMHGAWIDVQRKRLVEHKHKLERELAQVDDALAALALDTEEASQQTGADNTQMPEQCLSTGREPKQWRALRDAQSEIAMLRAAGRLVPFGAPGRVPRVYIDGCFDLMHSGHMNAIRQAKLLAREVGGTLVVGVHTDVEIERNKGPPLMRDAERLAIVCAVRWVDEVIFDTPYSATLGFLDSLDIDFCVHGDDMSISADGTDAYGEAKEAGRIKIIKRTEGISTTDLVGRLLLETRSHHSPLADAALLTSGAAAADYRAANVSSSGVSQFLPTTRRLRQFSTGRVPQANEKIVYVDGDFDLLHAGHIDLLRAAHRLGDFLIVGLHDDNTVNQWRGGNHPIMSLHERALCTLSLEYVDEVILGAPWHVTRDLLHSMNITTVVESERVAEKEPTGTTMMEDRYAAARQCGASIYIQQTRSLRTDDIVNRIIEGRQRFEKRNGKREMKELHYIQHEKSYVREL